MNDPGHTFPGTAEEVGRMRAALRRELDRCPVADDVLLCASELAANAVLHSSTGIAGGKFTVRAEISLGQSVLIEVEDEGGPWRGRSHELSGGRGLGIVSALASAWGCRVGGHSRTVWARFDWSAAG